MALADNIMLADVLAPKVGLQCDEPYGISGGLQQYLFVFCCILYLYIAVLFAGYKSTTTNKSRQSISRYLSLFQT